MNMLQRFHALVDKSAHLPGVRRVIERSVQDDFVGNRDQNLFHGVYDSFEAAEAQAEAYGVAGYDNEASANLYLDYLRVDAHDYPSMFWLERSFHDGMRSVFDIGGSIGIKYYAFEKSVPLPPDVRWLVEDVPAVVARGRELAAERGAPHTLAFTDEMRAGDGSDLVFASGSLQYLPQTLGAILSEWSRPPRRIVINITPIHPSQAYFTVNSIGTAFCPYRVQTHAALVRELGTLGYRLRDHWLNRGKHLLLPMHPELSLDHYSGYCLDLLR